MLNRFQQNPAPGVRLLKFRGDTLTFTLSLPEFYPGNAWLRTNIGAADILRDEIIKAVNQNEPPLARDWFDIPMNRVDDRKFQVTIPLCEVGHFDAKCYFLEKGKDTPLWPPGGNTAINVEPTDTCCANIIYNTFVRQFGSKKNHGYLPDSREEHWIELLDKAGYTVIPPSGTFRDLVKELDFIMGELGCRIIQLLPVHPTPTTYARMGRYGSPYAALSFTSVDPALAEFDPRATPLEQFVELVDAIHERHAKIFIDIAINHTGWASSLHGTHPEWLVRDPEGRIEVPGAWGVLWEDLTRLDYRHKGLWQYMANIYLTWCRRGVDGFRCDAGYMIPVPVWKYIVATVREQYPDTIFLLEGLGGKISVNRDILNTANFNWAYSELFQNYDRSQIENYLPQTIEISQGEGIMVHFAETHDNIRLAARSNTFARMRTALCALCSFNGAFGFANGVEWYATERIDVHDCPSLNWGAKINQVNEIRRLNLLLKNHPVFHDQVKLTMIQQDGGNHIALLRHHVGSGKKLLILANLDDQNQTFASWDFRRAGMEGHVLVDLLTEKDIVTARTGTIDTYRLDAGQVLCLSSDPTDIELIRQVVQKTSLLPDRIKTQRLRAKALDVFRFYRGTCDLGDYNVDTSARQLAENPGQYCRNLNPLSEETRVISWQWPSDEHREVMVPPDHFLLVKAETHFHARIMDGNRCLAHEDSLPRSDGTFFALFKPLPPPEVHHCCNLKMSIYTPGQCEHADGPVLFLSRPENAGVKRVFHRSELLNRSLLFLGTNGHGGMLRAPVSWGKLGSRYDALLAANLNPDFPEDRWIMFSRCRAWIVFQGYSQEVSPDCLDSFCFDNPSRGFWRFHVPTGQGQYILFSVGVEMLSGENAMRIIFFRHPATKQSGKLEDTKPVKLILRPDIEDRTFHAVTKAYMGPENHWPGSVKASSNGFVFSPSSEHRLDVRISQGAFTSEPEWNYMVYRPVEADRGLDPDSDLFSPGYFAAHLKGNQAVELAARILPSTDRKSAVSESLKRYMQSARFEKDICLEPCDILRQVLDCYVVKRGDLKSVIAGYPWFLDWGRDALIFVRGLIAAQKTQDARAVLKQFGQFEEDGTLPNMILGQNAGNRDTSDAPLWFFVSTADLLHAEGNDAFLDEDCGHRTVREVLISIGRAFERGTFNGIRMDPESGLIFSPPHFTWMDTNHPAGTPRGGYPIEIQALWHFALSFLARIDTSEARRWKNIARRVKKSIIEYYLIKKEGYLSDCLHAGSNESAGQAEPDDALRPNQLFAITMGALTDAGVCRKIVTSCEELLIPGAIRSLADRPVRRALAVIHHGHVINDPHHPYRGRYEGDEDTSRKLAYHNGTAWTWLFPSFCEAWVKAYGEGGKETALAWLSSSSRLVSEGCVGHVPEILDGNYPHKQRGCDAQAWGASEWLRVWLKLSTSNPTATKIG